MSINEQLANEATAAGGTPIDPSQPNYAISQEMRGHIETDFGDQVAGSEFYAAPDWSIAPGQTGLYVYSRGTNQTQRLPFD